MVKNINSITIKLSDFGLTTDSVNNLRTGKIGKNNSFIEKEPKGTLHLR